MFGTDEINPITNPSILQRQAMSRQNCMYLACFFYCINCIHLLISIRCMRVFYIVLPAVFVL